MPDTASYASLEEANAYFASRLHCDAWTNASEGDRLKALIMASVRIDLQPLRGRKVDPNQELEFPRVIDGVYQPGIPKCVTLACCEEALAILERGNDARTRAQRAGVQSVSLSGIAETYVAGAGQGLLSPDARGLLRPYLAGAVRIV